MYVYDIYTYLLLINRQLEHLEHTPLDFFSFSYIFIFIGWRFFTWGWRVDGRGWFQVFHFCMFSL